MSANDSFFKDKVVWITGASSGIGEALAIKLSQLNAKLILSARRAEELKRVLNLCKNKEWHLSLPLDMLKSEEFENKKRQVLQEFGCIDILINNAGISQRSTALDTDLEIVRKIMETNFFGSVALTKLVLPEMIMNNAGQIVVISSLMGKFATQLRSSYAASKHALVGYFEALRAELWHQRIQVIMVYPGFIKTNVSINSLTGNGKIYGQMDDAQNNGISPEKCADKILKAITKRKETVVIAKKERLGLILNRFFPGLLRKVIRKVRVI